LNMGAGENDSSRVHKRRPMSSTYGTSYLPTMEGTRTRVWKEGFDQRVARKQNGFRHVAIEWDVLTGRPLEDDKKYCDDAIKIEELFLPTSRIEKKRRQLNKEYERAKKREDRKRTELRKKLSVDDAGLIREININEYEKNKARNHKTNIQFPTPISTLRSSRSSKSSRSSSARPSRSKSAYHRQKTVETARLSESMSQLSVNDEKSNPRPLGLSQDQVNRLQAEAGMCATQPPQTSAMDRYMETKTKQELDNITCNH